ncbi:hypothetical protein BDW22DRAFT_1424247 [Trametopsis cervina]|nr:hypothetical protein BDW22DRAFT_1424247 [Trametopsis cervina]
MARLGSIVLLVAAALPLAFATNCKSGEFYFQAKSLCLPEGGQSNPPSPPSGKSCPTEGWQYHTGAECCVPTTPQPSNPPPPACKSDCSWDSKNYWCTPNQPRGPASPSPPPPPPATTHSPLPPPPATTHSPLPPPPATTHSPLPPPPASTHSPLPPPPATTYTPSQPTCGSNDFFFDKGNCCLPHGGVPNPPQPPPNHECPDGWYWKSDLGHCAPNHPQTPSSPPPSCKPTCSWSSSDYWCTPNPPASPPPSKPTSPATTTKPAPPAQSSSSCSSSDFWFPQIGCCPHGGVPNPPTPPGGVSCPTNGWYWHQQSGKCAPNHPQPPPPQCKPGCGWNPDQLHCSPPTPPSIPPPKPSGGYHKRHMKARTMTLCPTGLQACPLPGLMLSSGDYDCVDPVNDLNSCGGCSSTGEGQDCSAIEGVWNVGCVRGQCKVDTCTDGYTVSVDGKSCRKL